MPNIIDYLDWRGDLTLDQSPFNDVDNLILSQLVYMRFDQILTVEKYNTLSSLSDVVRTLLAESDESERIANNLMSAPKTDRRFLAVLASTARFGSMQLTRYVNRIDYKKESQFSAITILTGDGSVYLAFRGTDDSLVGWKENFNMSFMTPVPAQQEAVEYLESVAFDYPESIRVGGHSKGGNLAVYAAAFCQPVIQNWILNVYSNDGPGFDRKVIDSEGYQNIHKRIHTLVPQSSVVGMLLEHEEAYTVVHSTGSGLMQHNPYSWEVLGRDFIRLATVDRNSRFVDQTLRSWISGMDQHQKEQFIDALYGVFAATEVKSTSELSGEWLKAARVILKSMSKLDEDTRKLINQTISSLFRSVRTSLKERERTSAERIGRTTKKTPELPAPK